MNIRFHKNFEKRYIKLPLTVQQQFKKRRDVFILNPFDPVLQNHMLKGKYKGYRSIAITGDYRAIYTLMDNDTIVFVEIGTHSELYS